MQVDEQRIFLSLVFRIQNLAKKYAPFDVLRPESDLHVIDYEIPDVFSKRIRIKVSVSV